MKTHRYILFIIACVLSIGTGWAGTLGSQNYYYKASAKVSSTGGGKVYISSEEIHAGVTYQANMTETFEKEGYKVTPWFGGSTTYYGVTPTVYLDAQPDPGYKFVGWKLNGNSVTSPYNGENNVTAIDSQNAPNVGTFEAFFEAMEVFVSNVFAICFFIFSILDK